jgi:hypothetical protein
MRLFRLLSALLAVGLPQAIAAAETLTVAQRPVADEKAVFATVESISVVPARGRIGGTVVQLKVREGDQVTAGQAITTIGGLGRFLPFEVDPISAAYATGQLAPQGLFGGLLGGLAGGFGGRAIGNLFGGSGGAIGSQVGRTIGSIAGGFLPFQVDPLTAAYASGQLA